MRQSIQQSNFQLLRNYESVYLPERVALIGTDDNRSQVVNTLGVLGEPPIPVPYVLS